MKHRLGVCIAGLDGAVASTLAAGVALLRRGLAEPLGLLSEEFVTSHDLAGFDSLVFGGWDPRGESVFEAVLRHRVLEPARLPPVAKELAALKPFSRTGSLAPARLAQDIAAFRRQRDLAAVVLVNLLPTGAHTASRAYAAAAALSGCPLLNFTPNDCAQDKLAAIPFCGRDGKTGQTWLKSVLAPALRDRDLRITGWYSTNLLGNEDGKIVGDPKLGRAKIRDKSKLLGEMLGYAPHHQVQINYYPPRGDNKESWDAIDFAGFLGMPMQLKVNGLWRDSILAAPMCLDLVRFLDLARRRGETGPQEWLSLYFKSPYTTDRHRLPLHDFHRQEQMLREYLEQARVVTGRSEFRSRPRAAESRMKFAPTRRGEGNRNSRSN